MTCAFIGSIVIDSDNYDVDIDGNSVTIDVGEYYIYHPTAGECLLDQIVEACSPHVTIAYSISSSGIITLSAGSTFSLTLDADLFQALGFNWPATRSGSSSYTADKQMRYSWFPGVDPVDSLAPTSRRGVPIDFGNQQQTNESLVFTSHVARIYEQRLKFDFVALAKTWNTNNDYASFEEFWEDHYSIGGKFVFIPLWTTETYYWGYTGKLDDEMRAPVVRGLKGSDTYWSIDLALRSIG